MAMHRSRPDQSRGVFETFLVRAGRPVELSAHMARLRRSLRALYAADVPDGAEELVCRQAGDVALGRLRLTVVPGDPGPLTTSVRATAVEPAIVFPEAGVRLAPLTVPGGWGPHKWVDRGVLERAEADGTVPLIVDDRATVLEASRANVFIVEAGRIVTPPADGRILPGVTRARLLALLDVREETVSLDRLASADEVFLSGSVRGVEPVSGWDGQRLNGPGDVTRAAAAQLERHWEEEP